MIIEAAKPEDCDALVPLIFSSGPVTFDYVFLNAAEDFLHATLPKTSSSFSYCAHWVARETETRNACASISLYTRAEHDARHNGNIGALLSWGGWRSPLIIVKGLKVEALIPPPPPGTLHIAHLGVAPTMRSQGLGVELIRYAETKARAQNIHSLSLDVSAQNPRAQALYERLGFVVKHTNISKINVLADHHYMEKPLD
ncbi:GNAT family N-acetyltransferase [Simiduia curdlanivorans]|uniref:GNAT family N-acetyltransferase n=1 Tax=Simiduia curdlanivorans TaxID=1492769 RepID=A0ABV8V1F8_9GAMM|nr:GNAT family N-acetyltransferase [Simiduia curdlanivorans]MDN3637629.1 GNAT family N-acetyltransferase [Simiduia curdlanivorans]